MNMVKHSLFFATVLSIGIGDLATAQQQPELLAAREAARKLDENLVTQVFQIKNIDLEDAYQAVRTVYNLSHIAAVEGNNTLAIRDTPQRLEQIADLIAQTQLFQTELIHRLGELGRGFNGAHGPIEFRGLAQIQRPITIADVPGEVLELRLHLLGRLRDGADAAAHRKKPP